MSQKITNHWNHLKSFFAAKPTFLLPISFVAGLGIGKVFLTKREGRSQTPNSKEGLFMVLQTPRLTDPQADLLLRGKQVQIVRHTSEAPCRIDHTPLLFSANERMLTLFGSLPDLESIILSVTAEDLQHLDLAAANDITLPPCMKQTKVVYGNG